jgi:hypothetical protein
MLRTFVFTLPDVRLLGRSGDPGDRARAVKQQDAMIGEFDVNPSAARQLLGGRHKADDLQMVEGIGYEAARLRPVKFTRTLSVAITGENKARIFRNFNSLTRAIAYDRMRSPGKNHSDSVVSGGFEVMS